MDATEAAAVLARARQGDSDAFRALVEKHSRSVFRLAFRMTGNEQDAEDVVQESFLRAYRQLGRFESRANFGTWLYRIVANCSVDLMRSKQARHDQVRGDSLDAGAMELPAVNVPGPERMAESAEIERRGLQKSVIGIPKTIDNDIMYLDKSFGFETAFAEAVKAVTCAHVESLGSRNGVGVAFSDVFAERR